MTPPLTLTHHARLVSLNHERRESRWSRHEATRAWRDAAKILGLNARHQPFTVPVHITIEPFHARGPMTDTGNIYPSAKAFIDGLRDAGLIADDTGAQVAGITMLAPKRGPDGLTVTVEEVP